MMSTNSLFIYLFYITVITLHAKTVHRGDLCNGCNMAMRDLPDMYTRGPRDEGIHIRQITNGHVTTIMYHFVPIVTTPVV